MAKQYLNDYDLYGSIFINDTHYIIYDDTFYRIRGVVDSRQKIYDTIFDTLIKGNECEKLYLNKENYISNNILPANDDNMYSFQSRYFKKVYNFTSDNKYSIYIEYDYDFNIIDVITLFNNALKYNIMMSNFYNLMYKIK